MGEWGGQTFSEGALPSTNRFVRNDGVADILDGLCAVIANATSATTVLIAQRNPTLGTIEVKGRYGTLLSEVDMTFVLPELNATVSPTLASPDLRTDQRFANHPLLRLMPHAKSLIAMLVPACSDTDRAVLKIINPRRTVFSDAVIWLELTKFSEVIGKVLCLKASLYASTQNQITTKEPQFAELTEKFRSPPPTVGNGVGQDSEPAKSSCVAFLFDTLVKKRTLHSRNGVDFLTLRTWRGPMKTYQIATLISLKKDKPSELVRRAASELAFAAVHMHGEGNIRCVVPVPGGNSGDDRSFSVLVAHEVAAQLKIPCEDLLASPDKSTKPGKSTPHKSASLKPFTMKRNVSGPILVIDDVVSSGKHMEMAISALRQQTSAVYGIAWIGK